MMIMSNKNKTIEISLSNNVSIKKEQNMPATFLPEMPVVICDDAEEAMRIQKEVNVFIHDLVNDIIKEKR